MTIVPPITRIESRIASITSRFGVGAGGDATGTAFGSAVVTEFTAPDTPAGFDPFGAKYQEAVAAAAAERARRAMFAAAATYGPGGSSNYAWTGPTIVPGSTFVLGPTPGASRGRIGGFGPMPVPEELAAYGNGQVPTEALTPVGQGGHRLWGPAAEAWRACVEAARADGIDLTITDSYRTYDQQVDLVNRKGLYSQGGYGAVPGTSNHGWGLAVDADVTDQRTLDWMRANAYRFGYVEAVPREPWHWEFRPQQA
jgi:D-alanyl-D-alanine carboxypeptidase